MSKTDTEKTKDAPKDAQPEVVLITIDDFCRAQSHDDRRVEMIAAFHRFESDAGRTTGVESEYAARYQQFVNAPA